MMNEILQPQTEGLQEVGTFYVRGIWHRAGEHRDPGHKHLIDHMGVLCAGRCNVHWHSPDTGERGVFANLRPGAKINVQAGRHHSLEVLGGEDVFWECWFSKAEVHARYPDLEVSAAATLEVD